MPFQIFTSSGSFQLPLTADPATVAVYGWAEGGNSSASIATTHSGAGGGSGALAGEPTLGGLRVGSILSFTIGGGGSNTSTVITGGSVTITANFGASASGTTAGAGGTAGSNTLAIAGSAGGIGLAGTAKGGGGGGGSPGVSGAGGVGAAGNAGTAAGGTAGAGSAGPPNLAGAVGGAGGSPVLVGNNGISPGSGAGAPGNTASHGLTNGAGGQVIIVWSTLNGVGLTAALIGITAFAPTPSLSKLTITATGGGSSANGILLRARVLDNAALPTPPNQGNTTASASTAADVALSPEATGSLAYSVVYAVSGTPAAATGNTVIDSVADHGTYVSTATLTFNTPFTAGSAAVPATGGAAAVEVMPFGGTISTDASSPAVVNNTGSTTATTAGFAAPLGGKLILALVSMAGGTGTAAMALTDSHGLTWTQAVAANDAGNGYAGIWYAYTPANLSLLNIAPPSAVVGTAYSYTLTANGGWGAFGWSLASGSLPAGLSLSGAGVISGTPTTAGLSTFTLSVADSFGNTATSPSISMVVNQGFTGSGFIRAGWTNAAAEYTYGTLEVPVATTEHDWILVSVSWQDGEDMGIAYCSDNVHNLYQTVSYGLSGTVNTQVFAVPNSRAANTVYVSTSAFVRWLTVQVLDLTGLQPGLTVDAQQGYNGGPGTSLVMNLSTAHPDLVLAVGAFGGTPQTLTASGSGATWTSLYGGINGTASTGITQTAAWASVSGSASPAMTFGGASGAYSGAMIAFYTQGGLPVNSNPAWPVIKCQAAFGYVPQEPTAPVTWTDISSRFLQLSGQRGRSFELDELAAADITVTLDNFDGALSPQNSSSPYAPNVTLITPIQVTATWQGRIYTIFRGVMTALPQTYDFQRGVVKVDATDEFSKLALTLLPTAMIQEALYDKPVSLWPLNEQQGAPNASNWSGRSTAVLTPVISSTGGGGTVPTTGQSINIFGSTVPVNTGVTLAWIQSLFNGAIASTGKSGSSTAAAASPPPTPTTPTTGFGNSNTGNYPSGLAGTQDTVWGNTGVVTTSSFFSGSVLVVNGDALPLTATGATYSVWAQMYFIASNTNATIMVLSDVNGTAGTKNYLTLSYTGTTVTVSQTGITQTFTAPAYLFDSKWHMWSVTVSTAGLITVYVDGAALGNFTGTFPGGSPSMLQLGGDTTATTAATAGMFTGCMVNAATYDRVVDPERIYSWFLSGSTGFLDELAGTRIQRILAWARWGAPQACDPGLSMQQAFNYLTGGYGNGGISGSVGDFATAGGAIGIDNGAQADMTAQDVANTDNGFMFMGADGTFGFRERTNITFPLGLALGDMDYALNLWSGFETGLGPWTTVSGCTVAQSSGWSYTGKHSALITVTGTPATAYAYGDKATVQANEALGFSCWVMSPQGCTVAGVIDFYNSTPSLISTATTGNVNCPPMTPVFLNLTGVTAPAGAVTAYPHPVITSSPATGTQLYFDHPRLSPTGFACPYGESVEITEDIQYLFNDVAITRNVDQASYRGRNQASRLKYWPRVYTRTVYSSADDLTAVPNCASFLVTNFAFPALRVQNLVINAAENPEAWLFVLNADIGDSVSFTRTPVGGASVTGTFTILSVEPDIGPDKAQFTYVLAPGGVY